MGCWHAAPSGSSPQNPSLCWGPFHPGSRAITVQTGGASACQQQKVTPPPRDKAGTRAGLSPLPCGMGCAVACGVFPRSTRQLCPGPCRLRCRWAPPRSRRALSLCAGQGHAWTRRACPPPAKSEIKFALRGKHLGFGCLFLCWPKFRYVQPRRRSGTYQGKIGVSTDFQPLTRF